ncbi:Ribosome biogenesis protein WDR12 [Chionoecetes opilio]|uniref:Ribosome biogenesis protein WDR12 n=1 Tax=Chionoecetes opilio TaxID=41210 RepID=A0A8J5C0H8_CHIOP|nr:Ribosome biogenesis protein WDR12 [Chionoecetes opilio]
MAGSGGDESVLVKFVTKQEQYAVSGAPVLVDVQKNAAKLNELLHVFIRQGTQASRELPKFEFVVEGQLLVGKLGLHLEERERSLEGVVEVEYLEKLPPPTPKDSLHHDDWVSTVHASKQWLLTGCYDNTLHLWSMEGLAAGQGDRAHRLTIPAHRAPVKAVTWLNGDTSPYSFISTSIDQTAVVWVWRSETNAVECVSECYGHTQSVECVAVDEKKEYFATGSWDNLLKIWTTDSLSSLHLLLSRHPRSSTSLVHTIQRALHLTNEGWEIAFQWVPSHAGIPGNEVADSAARMALTDVNTTPFPLPLSAAKRLISRVCRSTWNNTLGDALRITSMGHYRSDFPPAVDTEKCPRFHSHRLVLQSQLLVLNVATCYLPTLLAAAGVPPSRQHAVIRLTCAFLRKTGQLPRL